MTDQVKDCRVLQQGQHILVELKEAISEIRNLESLCADHIGPLLHCEETLEMVAIDLASVCTDGADWREIRQMVTEAGIEISEDLDRDLSQIHSGDDSCLK